MYTPKIQKLVLLTPNYYFLTFCPKLKYFSLFLYCKHVRSVLHRIGKQRTG